MNTGDSFRVIATTTPKSNSGEFYVHDSSICEVYVPKSTVVLVAKFLDIEAMAKVADDKIYQILHGEMTGKDCICKDNDILKCLKQNKAIAYKIYTKDKAEHILHPSRVQELERNLDGEDY